MWGRVYTFRCYGVGAVMRLSCYLHRCRMSYKHFFFIICIREKESRALSPPQPQLAPAVTGLVHFKRISEG